MADDAGRVAGLVFGAGDHPFRPDAAVRAAAVAQDPQAADPARSSRSGVGSAGHDGRVLSRRGSLCHAVCPAADLPGHRGRLGVHGFRPDHLDDVGPGRDLFQPGVRGDRNPAGGGAAALRAGMDLTRRGRFKRIAGASGSGLILKQVRYAAPGVLRLPALYARRTAHFGKNELSSLGSPKFTVTNSEACLSGFRSSAGVWMAMRDNPARGR
ncbi:hypothetical protein HOE425_340134 [Hoeflea sp. EC-HK425]|nr:hypothetical protein HOE425_340134 [Hoeflea sp. EC-HK425]